MGVLMIALGLSAACGVHGLGFVRDERIEIVRPRHRATVSLPLHVEWKATGLAVPAGGGSFGVFVDRAPQRAGATVESLFGEACPHERDTNLCRADYLRQRNVYATTSTAFTVEAVPRLTGSQRRRLHEITIVILDANGRRVGEGSWSVQFRLEGE
jgi:hypothetical protein